MLEFLTTLYLDLCFFLVVLMLLPSQEAAIYFMCNMQNGSISITQKQSLRSAAYLQNYAPINVLPSGEWEGMGDWGPGLPYGITVNIFENWL